MAAEVGMVDGSRVQLVPAPCGRACYRMGGPPPNSRPRPYRAPVRCRSRAVGQRPLPKAAEHGETRSGRQCPGQLLTACFEALGELGQLLARHDAGIVGQNAPVEDATSGAGLAPAIKESLHAGAQDTGQDAAGGRPEFRVTEEVVIGNVAGRRW